jgi:hypothetical protein
MSAVLSSGFLRNEGVRDAQVKSISPAKAHDGKVQMIDSSIVRVHQHASGSKKEWSVVVLGEVEEASPRKNPRAGPKRRAARDPLADLGIWPLIIR